MKRYLLTGGAGFIGSHLLERLLSQGDELVVIDNLDKFYSPVEKYERIASFIESKSIRWLNGDITDPNLLKRICGPFDAIIHIAALAGVRPSIEAPALYQKVNVYGTACLLELARSLDIPRFIFASSSSVYGVNPNVPWSESDNNLSPISPYAASKLSAELLGKTFCHLYKIQFLSLRFFTVYGPRQRPDLAIRKFAGALIHRKPIPVFGDGSSARDYTYINDIIEGICGALGFLGSGFHIFNLGNSNPITLTDLLARLERILGVEAIIDYLPVQSGDVTNTWANIDRAKNLLGYLPQTSIDEGLELFVQWYKDFLGRD